MKTISFFNTQILFLYIGLVLKYTGKILNMTIDQDLKIELWSNTINRLGFLIITTVPRKNKGPQVSA